jgi:hypothetical protein
MLAPIDSCSKEMDWPTREDLKRSQGSGEEDRPDCLHLEEGLRQNGDQPVWIPKGYRDMQIRLLLRETRTRGPYIASTTLISQVYSFSGI